MRSKKWIDHSTASFYTVATTGQNKLKVERGVTEIREVAEGKLGAPGMDWITPTGSDGGGGTDVNTDPNLGQGT